METLNNQNQGQNCDTSTEDQEIHISDRRNRIMQMVNRDGSVRVSDLSRMFGISEVTIRNDLGELEKRELLERTHGGAIRTNKSYYHMSVQERMDTNKEEKMAIAHRAAKLVNEGDTLFINSGTTAVYLCKCLRGIRNLMVLTNSPLAAAEIGFSGECEVLLVGGSFNAQLSFTYGDDAVRQIACYHASKFFFSCDGISASAGVMAYNTHEVHVNRKFIENSSTVIAIADYSKIGHISRVTVDSVKCLDTLLTNAGANAAELDAIREKGVEVISV